MIRLLIIFKMSTPESVCELLIYKDMSDQATCRALYVLAGINFFVII